MLSVCKHMASKINSFSTRHKHCLFFVACALSISSMVAAYLYTVKMGRTLDDLLQPSEISHTKISLTHGTKQPISLSMRNSFYGVAQATFSDANTTSSPEIINATLLVPRPFVRVLGPRQMSHRKKKRILLWTKLWGEEWVGELDFRNCPVSDCIVTSARQELEQSDAVLFHHVDMKPGDVPPRRSAEQVWVFYDMESPCLTSLDFKGLENRFNWTISYRRDADIFFPYGRVLKRPTEERGKGGHSWLNQTRSKMALWMATKCDDHAKRKTVVTELAKYLPVDTFGKCGDRQLPEECGRYKNLLCPHLLRDYKFYLAFENAICRDYITEKLWNAFDRDQVPVVLGGGVDYEHLLPPHSYISVSQFPDIRALAEYLQHLASHPEEYNKYLLWKRDYWVSRDNRCSLCEAVHDARRPAQVYWNLEKWMYEDLDTCRCH